MAARKRIRKLSAKAQKRTIWSFLALLIVAFFAWSLETYGIPGQNAVPAGTSSSLGGEGTLRVWYADIGQADCQLIQTPQGKNILIDAGEAATGEELVQWLKAREVQELEAVIATHPHADHIGGMAEVIKAFPVGTFYMPRTADTQTPTTRVYEAMLEALSEKGIKISAVKGGMTLYEEEGLTLKSLAPLSDTYDDLNNYSIVSRLCYKNRSFLFTGDAETQVEKEILSSGADVRADVLKCGHHGSETSTSAKFLKAVSPSAAVISCGAGNDYGHPDSAIIKRLEKSKVSVYRTDTQGTILASCDGDTISFETGLPGVK